MQQSFSLPLLKEKKIKESLLFELDYQNLSVEVGDILVPSENIVEMKEGKKTSSHKVDERGEGAKETRLKR